jgi:tetratricopeptide (TPR) repeat protein
MAGIANMRDQTADARKHLEAGKQEHPEDWRFYQELARAEMVKPDNDAALAIIAEGVKAVPAKDSIQLLMFKADLQVANKDLAGLDVTKEEIRKAGNFDVLIEYIDVRKLLVEEKWYEAAKKLADMQQNVGGWLADSVGFQLGFAYEKLGQYDQAEKTYKALLARSPNNEPAKAGVQRVAALLRRPTKNAETSDLDAMVQAELKKPKDKQNWAVVDQKLTELAEKRNIKDAALDMFWARMMLYRQNYPEARKRLIAARNKDDKNVEVRRLAVLLLRAEDPKTGPAKALQLLDQTVEQFGDSPQLRLDRADCLIGINVQEPNPDKLKEQLADLSKLPSDWDDNEQITFLKDMAARYLQLNMRDEATANLKRVAELRPKDLPTLITLFGLALDANDDVAVKDAQDDILKVVGTKEDSNWLYTEAHRRLAQIKRGQADKESLGEIQILTERALKERPNWYELQILSAELELLKGDQKEALAHYEKAQELGRGNSPGHADPCAAAPQQRPPRTRQAADRAATRADAADRPRPRLRRSADQHQRN